MDEAPHHHADMWLAVGLFAMFILTLLYFSMKCTRLEDDLQVARGEVEKLKQQRKAEEDWRWELRADTAKAMERITVEEQNRVAGNFRAMQDLIDKKLKEVRLEDGRS